MSRSKRWDETWHRLSVWTNQQAQSERLAAQILLADGFSDLDPSHPLGGPDGGRDAIAFKDGHKWVVAAHFSRKTEHFGAIRKKFASDNKGVARHGAYGIAFVTNQEVSVTDRERLAASVENPCMLYHLERITAILDQPRMGSVRRQFGLEDEIDRAEAVFTGGDTYCYFMLYNFDMTTSVARDVVLIRRGEFPLYDVRMRVVELRSDDSVVEILNLNIGELNAAADQLDLKFKLSDQAYLRIFFHARNGSWHQDLQLRRSRIADAWLAATRVTGHQQVPDFQDVSAEFLREFGRPTWKS